MQVAGYFEEDKVNKLYDYRTASYFYQRCLQISVEHKFLEGEARAYQGLGMAENNVENKEAAMEHLVKSLNKAKEADDAKLVKLVKEISANLVKVYMEIASSQQEVGNFNDALEYYEKCLEVAKQADDVEIEAECYQRIGLIQHQRGEYNQAIEYTNQFLSLCDSQRKETKDEEKQHKIDNLIILGHKQLAETYVIDSQGISEAISHLTTVIEVATRSENKSAHAEACHKLGLLYNMDGKDKNPKKSLMFLNQHYEMLRQKSDENETGKDQKRIDLARVNIGIVEANKKMEEF